MRLCIRAFTMTSMATISHNTTSAQMEHWKQSKILTLNGRHFGYMAELEAPPMYFSNLWKMQPRKADTLSVQMAS